MYLNRIFWHFACRSESRKSTGQRSMSCYIITRVGRQRIRKKKKSFESKRLPDIELKNANGEGKKKRKKQSSLLSHLVLLDSIFFFFVNARTPTEAKRIQASSVVLPRHCERKRKRSLFCVKMGEALKLYLATTLYPPTYMTCVCTCTRSSQSFKVLCVCVILPIYRQQQQTRVPY